MTRIMHEEFDENGSGIRTYDDGREECFFSEREWEEMLSDPAFGYVCQHGHRMRDADHRFGACLTCETMMMEDW